MREFPPLEAAQAHFGPDRVAVGQVNIVHAPGKKPCLVVDSSVCRTYQASRVLERSSLPSLCDIRAAYPLGQDNEEVAAFVRISVLPAKQFGFVSAIKVSRRLSPARENCVLPCCPPWCNLFLSLVLPLRRIFSSESCASFSSSLTF